MNNYKVPWYKRIFGIKPSKEEYLGISLLTDHTTEKQHNAAIYKKYNPATGEIYAVWANMNFGRYYFDVNAYIKDKKLVPK